MSADEHRSALNGYEDAITKLYGESPLRARVASVGTTEVTPAPVDDEARVEAVVQASQAVTVSATSLLDAEDPLVRESGEAQLAALAARDIAIAFDIAQLEADERQAIASVDLEGPALPEIEQEIAFVLEADPADGVPPSASEWSNRAQLSGADTDPRKELREALPGAIDQVRDDATEVVVAGLGGLIGGQLDEMLGKLASGLLDQLPTKVKLWYQWALSLLKEGVAKLRALFGKAFDKAVQRVWDWLKKHAPQALADRVYGVPDLSEELTALVDNASPDKDWAAISKEVDVVVHKHSTLKKIVLAVFKALNFARKWILRALAGLAGEIVVGAVFVLGAICGLFMGGDYVDWHRTDDDGAFNFVRGVRLTAAAGLQ